MGQLQREISRCFDNPNARAINAARLDHLASLGLDLENKRVLETGAGVGHLTGFWEERDCEIVGLEGRKTVMRENLRRHPHHEVFVADLTVPDLASRFGRFDIVFCYGTLYHLDNPEVGLQNMAEMCQGLLLLETMVWHEDDGGIHFGKEALDPHQSLHGLGCRPARDWVMAQLRERFEHAYLTRTQPNHPRFPLRWPVGVQAKPRAVFVASRAELDLPTLTKRLLKRQEITP